MGQKEYIAADLDHFWVYCALHPLHRALHSSKRFDCSSKWGCYHRDGADKEKMD